VICFCVTKTLHGLNSLNSIDLGLVYNENVTRGNGFKLVIPLVRLNVRAHFFSNRVIPVWNSLDAKVVDACSPIIPH